MRRIIAPLAILVSLGLAACDSSTTTNVAQTEKPEVVALDSAKVILDRHERTIKAGDLEGVMADYADDAVLVAPAGVVAGEPDVGGTNVFFGKDNIRKFFTVLTNAETLPAVKSMAATYEIQDNGNATMKWAQWPGTDKEVSGTDIWVIRNGKVVSQVVLVNPPKK